MELFREVGTVNATLGLTFWEGGTVDVTLGLIFRDGVGVLNFCGLGGGGGGVFLPRPCLMP